MVNVGSGHPEAAPGEVAAWAGRETATTIGLTHFRGGTTAGPEASPPNNKPFNNRRRGRDSAFLLFITLLQKDHLETRVSNIFQYQNQLGKMVGA